MTLSTTELDSLRHHLGYGNLSTAAEPYTADTYFEVFAGVVSPNLSTGNETSSTTAVIANTTQVITVVDATGISVYGQLVVDVGDQAETVLVKAVSGTNITAHFVKAHAASGYPVATMSGLARLRMLLWDADAAERAMMDGAVGSSAGLKKVDEVEFFGGAWVLRGRLDHYRAIVEQIARLVQVPPQWAEASSGAQRLAAY